MSGHEESHESLTDAQLDALLTSAGDALLHHVQETATVSEALLRLMAADQENTAESGSSRPSIGRVLQQARIAAGLTVDNISGSIRVRIAVVHAIEADDFAPCGGYVHARGHIRTLAEAVGLDPEPLLAQFAAEHAGERPAPTPATPPLRAERIHPKRRGPNWAAAMVAAIVVVVGFVGFTAFKSGDGKQSVAEVSTPTTSKPDKTPEPSDSAIAAAPHDKVTVQVSAVDGRSWVSAKDHNGRMLFDGLLKKGDSKTFQDSSRINLILGDAGAIQLHVNGKKIDHAGETGRVQRLSCTKGEPAQSEPVG